MFITALFIGAKQWKQTEHFSIKEQFCLYHIYINSVYIINYYEADKRRVKERKKKGGCGEGERRERVGKRARRREIKPEEFPSDTTEQNEEITCHLIPFEQSNNC